MSDLKAIRALLNKAKGDKPQIIVDLSALIYEEIRKQKCGTDDDACEIADAICDRLR